MLVEDRINRVLQGVKMKKAQQDRELLLETIFQKWNPIALGCRNNKGAVDCPLCEKYFITPLSCGLCPVKLHTKQDYCNGTPYARLLALELATEEYLDIIENELEFLISLLPLEDQENLESLHKEWIASHGQRRESPRNI